MQNKRRILRHFRKPAFNDLGIDPETVAPIFPGAETPKCGEVKLRVADQATALAILGRIAEHA